MQRFHLLIKTVFSRSCSRPLSLALTNKESFFSHNTVEPLLTDTSLIRTPLYYGQFTWSLRDRIPYKACLSKTDTSIMRTLIPVPLVSVIKRFDGIRQYTFSSPFSNVLAFEFKLIHVFVSCVSPGPCDTNVD